jgi:Zn-dependent protease
MNEIIQTIAVYALPVIFAITLHEAAHAFAAKYFGDATAFMLGRMSLNPFKHIDPLGTIVIPIALYVATSGAFVFGYAKPVPVNFGQLRHPKRDMAWVALAGPASNFLMALLWGILYFALPGVSSNEVFFFEMAKAGILVNLVMFAFNLFPVPPLDGGRIAVSLLPHRLAYRYSQLEPYGFFIVMALVLFKVIYTWWMIPVMGVSSSVLQFLLSPIANLWN